MKIRIYILLAVFICLSQVSRARNVSDTLFASSLKPYGRYIVNQQNELELISSAVHFGFKFQGGQCAIYASNKDSNDHNYIQYELDGIYQKRIRVEGDPTGPVIITATGTGEHTIWIYKATEATTGPVVISKIVAGHIKPLPVPKAPLIEFIGNSITCGAMADTSGFPCGTGEYHDHHNAYLAYGPRVARALGLNYILSSVSGIGVYRTWNTDNPSMPQVYENTDLHENSTLKWDFKKYNPKIVSIALGTNDMSNGDGKTPRKPFDEQIFISHYVDFVKLVKSKYPKAQIALLSSPMIKGNSRIVLEKCLTSIKTQIDSAYPNNKPVQTFFFSPMEPHGCGGHPSVADHLIMAQELEPFFRKLLE
jgi:lysophospholipase L1-like esterase